MRILTFTHLFPNKVHPVWGLFVYQRVAHFANRPGNQVTVVAPTPYIPRCGLLGRWRHQRLPLTEVVGGLPVVHPRYPHVPKIAMPLHGFLVFLGCYRRVAKLHRERPFDCIDSHWIYPDGFAAVLLGKSFGVPVFCSARGTDINVYPTFPLIRMLISWALKHATGIVAVSHALKRKIMELGIPEENIRVIGNGVDVDRFQPTDRGEARKKLGLPVEGRLAIAVGTLNEHKCHAMLISAMAEIESRWADLRLCILGEGALRGSLEKLIADKGLQGRVSLVGGQRNEDLKWWYNAADICCLSSVREGWPNVLMESLACGTPVVATRVGGVPEVISSSEMGTLVDPNVAAMVKGLEHALSNEWDRGAIARFARSRTWNEVAAEMEAFFVDRMNSSESVKSPPSL